MPGKHRRIQLIFVIYWLLLGYIIAALIFWFLALNQQNRQMTAFKLEKLNPAERNFTAKAQAVLREKKRKTAQYLGEGSTFLLLILAGAIFVFRSVRKQLRQNIEQQNFMIAITHELKTPIAVTRLNLQTLQKRKLNEAQQQRLIHNTLQEANRLNSLSTNMLLSSQMEAGGYAEAHEEVNWSEIVKKTVSDFSTRYPERKIALNVTEEFYVHGDKLLLEIVVNNLVENALKYSPKDASVNIELVKNNENVVLHVIDHGAGIADEEKKKVFQKFYRIGNEATKRAKGTGLGLYLTKRIINNHHGNIFITSNPGGGSTFTVTLKQES